MNNDENKITKENDDKDISLNDKDIKDNSNNRLNILFKFLWFFSAAFLFGISSIKETTVNNPTEYMELFPAFIIGSSLFAMYSIVVYILKEMPVFTNKADITIHNAADEAYQMVINNIKLILKFGVGSYLVSAVAITNFINIYIYDISFAAVICIIEVLIHVVYLFGNEEHCVVSKIKNKELFTIKWSKVAITLRYLSFIAIAMNYQALTLIPTVVPIA